MGPAKHPFNPLPLLRLTLAAGATLHAVQTVYDCVWGAGADAEAAETIAALGAKLNIADGPKAIADPSVKQALRANTEEAIARGVFGVPTFAYAGELFWGDDATPLFAAFLDDPQIFKRAPYARVEHATASAERQI